MRILNLKLFKFVPPAAKRKLVREYVFLEPVSIHKATIGEKSWIKVNLSVVFYNSPDSSWNNPFWE